MNNFTYSVPTVIHFGKGQISHLSELKESRSRVLMVYGGGSIKKNGIYDAAMKYMGDAGLEVFELGGVTPNPRVQLVRKGIEICKKNSVDMLLAVGGGSSIDCAKLIAAGVVYGGDPWDLMLDSSLIKGALPIYCVLTLAATGSEMDNSTVISDPTINSKMDICSDYIKPKMAILDPEYTFTVSKKQTAAGAVDIMSHIFESYFTNVEGTNLQRHISEALLKTVIEYAPIALETPDNYDARANLMWCSSLALNGLLSYGAEVSWCVHPIEHELSAYYDITHGIGLAILTPVWMEYVLNEKSVSQFADYGRNVWNIIEDDNIKAATAAIDKTKTFFSSLGMPSKLSEIGIDSTHFEEMAADCVRFCEGCYMPLTKEDIVNIYNKAL
ncbi:MAG: iron-containing alcohol dehydrogenase [Clostridiales bacterium]|nr:iron-containing alcohol dehydrogenase [Clostridiales bacterium]